MFHDDDFNIHFELCGIILELVRAQRCLCVGGKALKRCDRDFGNWK